MLNVVGRLSVNSIIFRPECQAVDLLVGNFFSVSTGT